MHINLPSKLRCDYLCSACGYRGSVEYNDPDAIAEPEPIPGNSRLLAEQAFRAAEVALEKKAQRSLGLLRCPSCQQRDRKLSRRAYRLRDRHGVFSAGPGGQAALGAGGGRGRGPFQPRPADRLAGPSPPA
jgi:hypothetical protein